jgi:hypothetical protein
LEKPSDFHFQDLQHLLQLIADAMLLLNLQALL